MSDLSPAEQLAALEKLEREEADAEAKAREEQFVKDRLAMYALGKSKGFKVHFSAQVRQYVAGLPVVVGVRAPEAAEYKRMFKMVNKSGNNGDAKVAAHELLADVCWVYPEDRASREAMLEANAGLLASIGNFVNKLAEVELREEGKE